jgi:hypothetical protein
MIISTLDGFINLSVQVHLFLSMVSLISHLLHEQEREKREHRASLFQSYKTRKSEIFHKILSLAIKNRKKKTCVAKVTEKCPLLRPMATSTDRCLQSGSCLTVLERMRPHVTVVGFRSSFV